MLSTIPYWSRSIPRLGCRYWRIVRSALYFFWVSISLLGWADLVWLGRMTNQHIARCGSEPNSSAFPMIPLTTFTMASMKRFDLMCLFSWQYKVQCYFLDGVFAHTCEEMIKVISHSFFIFAVVSLGSWLLWYAWIDFHIQFVLFLLFWICCFTYSLSAGWISDFTFGNRSYCDQAYGSWLFLALFVHWSLLRIRVWISSVT